MLRFITQKFRNQSLNEVRPIENQTCSWLTEDLDELETCRGDKGQQSQDQSDYGAVCNNNCTNWDDEDPVTVDAQLKELTPENYPENASWNLFPTRINCIDSGDMKDTKDEVVRDESKENHPCLVPIMDFTKLDHATTSNRRKFSDVKRRKAESSSESSSSDDEIKELCSHGVSKIRALSRPPDKIVAISSSFTVTQRRRSKGSMPRFQSSQRPSINFDKMQQTLLKRQRNRVVRVRTISSLQSASRHYDPSLLGFKPIANLNPCISHLAPVEDPLAF